MRHRIDMLQSWYCYDPFRIFFVDEARFLKLPSEHKYNEEALNRRTVLQSSRREVTAPSESLRIRHSYLVLPLASLVVTSPGAVHPSVG